MLLINALHDLCKENRTVCEKTPKTPQRIISLVSSETQIKTLSYAVINTFSARIDDNMIAWVMHTKVSGTHYSKTI